MKETKTFEIGKTYPGKGEVKGIDFKLLDRKEDLCMFERSDGYYEVIEIYKQEASEATIKGKKISFKEKEVYPSSEKWAGKCVQTLERAKELFNI